MINNIGFNQNVQIIKTPCFKSKQENSPVSNPNGTNNLNGADALASYNSAFINKQDKFNFPAIKPIPIPKDIDSIDGEKIYNSKGVLECVEQEKGNEKIIYWPNGNSDKEVKFIEIYNKTTGNKIISQAHFQTLEDDKNPAKDIIFLTSYDPISGLEQANTNYENGELVSKGRFKTYPDGSVEDRTYNYKDKVYSFYKNDVKNNSSVFKTYDNNMNLLSEQIHKNKSNGYTNKDIKYANGKSAITKKTEIIGEEVSEYSKYIQNPNLKFDPCPELITDISNLEGTKTYYSNGKLESVKTPDGKLYESSINGNSITIHDKNRTLEYDYEQGTGKYRCQVKENLGDAEKQTIYFDLLGEKCGNVTYTKNNVSQFIYYDNGVPMSYEERDESKDWSDNLIIGIDFNHDGSLLGVYHSYEERDI